MSATLLDGKKISVNIRNQIANEIIERKKNNVPTPHLAVILIGDDEASKIYVKNKKKACKNIGIKSVSYNLDVNITTADLLELINKLNKDTKINGILVQLPLPKHIDTKLIIEAISPKKDVDGFHPYNLGRLSQNNPLMHPCTPYGIIKLLKAYDINLEGINAVVVGESNIVGRPMFFELLQEKATVTICHKYTKNLENFIKNAKLLIVAVGIPHLIRGEWIKEDAILVDVGINRQDDGRIVGDIDFNKAKNKAMYITPVPGGVGPMTITTLLENTLLAQKLQLIDAQ